MGERRSGRSATALGVVLASVLTSISPALAEGAPDASGAVILSARLDAGPATGPDGIDVFTFSGAPRSRQVVVGIGFLVVSALLFTTMTDGKACGVGCVDMPPRPWDPGGVVHH